MWWVWLCCGTTICTQFCWENIQGWLFSISSNEVVYLSGDRAISQRRKMNQERRSWRRSMAPFSSWRISCYGLEVWVVEKWRHLLYILHKLLTYEGRYSLTYLYHIHHLLHLKLGNLINFPHFLLKSLDRMSKSMQKSWYNQISFKLCHYGLIQMLFKKELEDKGTTWESFLKTL